jgi:hypothetical protein
LLTAVLRSLLLVNGAGAPDEDDDGGGVAGGEERTHALGGPSTDEDPSTRTYDASHADASSNMPCMSVTELVSQPEMSASNADAL